MRHGTCRIEVEDDGSDGVIVARPPSTIRGSGMGDSALPAPLPRSDAERRLVGRFADAFEAGDVATVVELLTDDAWLTMPPVPLEYQGRDRIARFLSTVPADGDLRRFRLVPTRANGQPAFGLYLRDPQCPIAHATGILLLTLEGERIAALTAFHDTGVLPLFGLPRTLPVD